MIRPATAFLAILLAAGSASAETSRANPVYSGLCEASAAVFLGDPKGSQQFAVASDEVNRLRTYDLDAAGKGSVQDVSGFTGHDKSDFEGGARIGDAVWWISSHSSTSSGKGKSQRRVLLQTWLTWGAKGPKLTPVAMATDLRDDIADAAGADPAQLNIEGLAAGTGGALLIGLRAPLAKGMAQMVPLLNPDEVVQDRPARFGPVARIDLNGYGIRSLDRLADGRYLIVAGPVEDGSAAFRLYLWDGGSGQPQPLATPPLKGLRPEAAFQRDDGNIMLLSDDGDPCAEQGLADDDPDGATDRHFRWVLIDLP